MSGSHSWEAPGAHTWEGPSDNESSGGEGDTITRASAGSELFEMLVSLRRCGKLGSRDVCLLAYWAHHAGAVGAVALLALHPNASSGNYQRHFDCAVGFDAKSDRYTTLQVPGHAGHDLSRVLHDVAALPPHEALVEEMLEDASMEAELRQALESSSLPRAYMNSSGIATLWYTQWPCT